MKAKLICQTSGISQMTYGKIYDVEVCDDKKYWVVNDEGARIDLYKSRFEVVSPIEEKTAEIKETEARLEVLKKELAELKEPKVGQKYSHRYMDEKYVLAEVGWPNDKEFALVCYEGKNVGRTYDYPVESLRSAFCKNEEFFTLLPE